ncbi:tetratricopeptide repeat protein [Saccharothrix sp. NPDC042600]|uniref:tetratricopeptide repeat protein n=1 Tax=Saccharothrix TaxID=2071 RepID=UPI0033CAE069|nr:hypothetical protein GCM10017745_67590 [Saccharothrix mutabilis subsp. capreolus]
MQALAAQRGWDAALWQLAWSANMFRLRCGHLHDNATAWLAAVAAADRTSAPGVRAACRLNLGQTLTDLDRIEEAREHLTRGLTLAEQADDTRTAAWIHSCLAQTWAPQGDNREAVAHATDALELCRALDRPRDIALALGNLGWFQAQLGEYADARSSCEDALALVRQLSLREGGEAETLDSLGYIAHHTGDFADAVRYFQEALDLARDIGNANLEAEVLDHIAETRTALRQPAEARQAWERAAELFRTQFRLTEAERVERRLRETPPTTVRG